MRILSWATILLALLLSACATMEQMQNDLSNSTAVPTASYQEMQFQPIQQAKPITVTLGKESPVYNFEGGRSYYSALTIEKVESPRKLKFKSYISSSYLPAATVYYPLFIFLDESKAVIGNARKYRFESTSDFFMGSAFEGAVVVPSGAKYIVIYTEDSNLAALDIYSENGRPWSVPTAPAGKLVLELSAPFPPDYDFSTAVIRDSYQSMGSDSANFFYVSHIDGSRVDDSRMVTLKRNRGRGFNMTPHVIDREVPVKTAKYTIVGRTEYAAPILALTHTVYEVKGDIELPLEAGKVYEVQGELGEEYSAVWLEEVGSGKVVGQKIEIKGPSKLGVLGK